MSWVNPALFKSLCPKMLDCWYGERKYICRCCKQQKIRIANRTQLFAENIIIRFLQRNCFPKKFIDSLKSDVFDNDLFWRNVYIMSRKNTPYTWDNCLDCMFVYIHEYITYYNNKLSFAFMI
jgi:hypothetical protein